MNKPVDKVSLNMTGVLSVYSLLFMRFAWMVTPRNYLLLACHAANESVQLYQLQRKLRHECVGTVSREGGWGRGSRSRRSAPDRRTQAPPTRVAPPSPAAHPPRPYP